MSGDRPTGRAPTSTSWRCRPNETSTTSTSRILPTGGLHRSNTNVIHIIQHDTYHASNPPRGRSPPASPPPPTQRTIAGPGRQHLCAGFVPWRRSASFCLPLLRRHHSANRPQGHHINVFQDAPPASAGVQGYGRAVQLRHSSASFDRAIWDPHHQGNFIYHHLRDGFDRAIWRHNGARADPTASPFVPPTAPCGFWCSRSPPPRFPPMSRGLINYPTVSNMTLYNIYRPITGRVKVVHLSDAHPRVESLIPTLIHHRVLCSILMLSIHMLGTQVMLFILSTLIHQGLLMPFTRLDPYGPPPRNQLRGHELRHCLGVWGPHPHPRVTTLDPYGLPPRNQQRGHERRHRLGVWGPFLILLFSPPLRPTAPPPPTPTLTHYQGTKR